jgi:hypothetical protein
MTYWLIVLLTSPEGELLERSSYEAATIEQCLVWVGDEARKIVNTQTQGQFHCLSDSEYRTEVLKELP